MDLFAGKLEVFMLVGIAVVVAVSQFHRVLGSFMGAVFWLAVGGLGLWIYAQGGAIGIGSFRFPKLLFFGGVGMFCLFNLFLAKQALQQRRRPRPQWDEDEEGDPNDTTQ